MPPDPFQPNKIRKSARSGGAGHGGPCPAKSHASVISRIPACDSIGVSHLEHPERLHHGRLQKLRGDTLDNVEITAAQRKDAKHLLVFVEKRTRTTTHAKRMKMLLIQLATLRFGIHRNNEIVVLAPKRVVVHLFKISNYCMFGQAAHYRRFAIVRVLAPSRSLQVRSRLLVSSFQKTDFPGHLSTAASG